MVFDLEIFNLSYLKMIKLVLFFSLLFILLVKYLWRATHNDACRMLFIGFFTEANNTGDFDGKQSYAVRQRLLFG